MPPSPTLAEPCSDGNDRGDAVEEFHSLCMRTRLILAREFESFGMNMDDAVAYAQDFVIRLAAVFLASGPGSCVDVNAFAEGVTRALNRRLGGRSACVWEYIANEMLPIFGRGSLAQAASGPAGGMFGEPLSSFTRFLDLRPIWFFGDIGVGKGRLCEPGRDAVYQEGRHRGLSPVIDSLLGMSSHRLVGRARAAVLSRVFEGSALGSATGSDSGRLGRKRVGAFYTPAYMARQLCRDAIIPWLSKSGTAADPLSLVSEYAGDMDSLETRLRRIQVLDPACGPGVFLVEAACTLLDIRGEIGRYRGERAGQEESEPWSVVHSLYGMDVDPRATEIARLALLLLVDGQENFGETLPDLTRNIVARDSVANLGGGWSAEFPGVFRRGGFDVIVGNPPYVRHEELRDKASMELPRGSGLSLPPGFGIPRKSDLASYFHYHSVAGLAPGGRLAFIASDGWLGHAYGLPLQRVLLDNCRIDALLRPDYNVFGGAAIKTAVLHLTRAPAGRGHRIDVAAIGGPEGLADWRGGIAARPLQAEAEPGNWLAQLFGAAPAPAPRAPMTTAGAAGRVESCVKTGRDGFFVLTPEAAREHGIGDAFRRPVLSARADDGCLEGREARDHLLSADLPRGRLAGTAAGRRVLRYIEAAELAPVSPRRGASGGARRIQDLSSLRGRTPWYSLGLPRDPPPVYLSIFTNKRIKVYRNDGRFLARNNFAAFTPRNGAHADALSAHFASSWFGLHMEAHGHVAGGGALQFLISDFRRSPVPDLERMGREDAGALGSAWRSYCADRDRARLDDSVLAVLGFTEAERSEVAGRLREAVSRRTGAGAAA